MKRYNPKELEPKWQKTWEEQGIYHASEDPAKPKRYVLEYFPYPSAASMHVGHVRNYTIGDAIARSMRMQGYNVLHPMGWDAFGLPAENYAIKTHTSPQEVIADSTQRFKRQLTQMGFSYDWTREINSSDPDYYKWTQWLFLLLFKRGLAYQKEALVNWDPVDKTVLANEQVIDGRADRSGALVEKKPLKQWFFKITEYADRLAADLDDLDWSDAIKAMQRNWIGRSRGAEIDFRVEKTSDSYVHSPETITVYTTRPDTIFGATFLVMAPELSDSMFVATKEKVKEVDEYIRTSLSKSEIERQETSREKTGVFTGTFAINPLNGKKIPIYIADYVLARYGTGSIMAVPAHDERDWEFAKKFDLPMVEVVQKPKSFEGCYSGEGTLINSESFDGISSSDAREKIIAYIEDNGIGNEQKNLKMSDWLISRQRYWGAPIPIIHCPKDGAVAVPDDQLPVKLPELKSYEPSGDGRSPLARVPEFVNTSCPKCGGHAERETDTMDGFACSSWYFLRFADPHNNKEAFDAKKAEFWLPVDDYIGGAEHAVMHLLYARFWTKVMHDAGLINFDEPFKSLRNQGMILAPDGAKMSKSKGNTIAPDELIEQGYGADSIRLMELFIGPWDQMAAWSVEGLGGTFRFLQRAWTLVQEYIETKPTQGKNDQALLVATHSVIKRVSEDMHELGLNTAIAALMEFTNELYRVKAQDNFTAKDWPFAITSLLQLLAPFAPHIAEELWHDLGNKDSIHISPWPAWDDKLLIADTITIVVQVNGKVRANLEVPADSTEEQITAKAKADPKVASHLKDQSIQKTVYVPGRLISFVI